MLVTTLGTLVLALTGHTLWNVMTTLVRAVKWWYPLQSAGGQGTKAYAKSNTSRHCSSRCRVSVALWIARKLQVGMVVGFLYLFATPFELESSYGSS